MLSVFLSNSSLVSQPHGTVPRLGDYEMWRNYPLAAIEGSGQQEVLNRCCLVGATAELGRRPDEATLIEFEIFNSTKGFTVFWP